jgi:hypothetical protein
LSSSPSPSSAPYSPSSFPTSNVLCSLLFTSEVTLVFNLSILYVKSHSHNNNSGFGEDFKRIAKKIQGGLPIIGLISRLTTPEGGFDELSYPEYCRSILEEAPPGLSANVDDLEKAYGKRASRRFVLFCCWLADCGAGIVPTASLLASARRIG